ncbi:B-cell linker protein isoform X2 [Melanotaenia boesemani]|uniref:B-cell linker protein isoform X2 n=1 Tax=Melanotaenia boesemani TaxID=1250792 RepID=UPI001C03E695|nr:B-cell linker protein isoform X2 [Melanotaenia boesemani]
MQTLGLNMNIDTLSKLAAPATAKIRQLQKLVQDIKKNDGSLLDKIRRLKSKPRPNVPARDYRDDNREGDQFSEPEYDNGSDTYEDPHDDDSYEPPPNQRVFKTPSASLPRGEYIDSCRNRPNQPPRKPLHPGKASKQLPPEPTHLGSDEDNYINPDATSDDDNYIEPAENTSPRFYEVPDKKNNSLTPSANRVLPVPSKQPQSLPPKPSPRVNMRRSPLPVQEPTGDDEYEVCDPDDDSCDKPAGGRPPRLPTPLSKERSLKPPTCLKPDLKPREFESRMLPSFSTDQKPVTKAFTMEFKRPKIPLPQLTLPKPAERGSVTAESGSLDEDKGADLYRKPWYASRCDRKTADDTLLRSNKDGAFMVRQSSGHDALQPYTLVVFYNGRVYNIPIRFIPNAQQYALGREKKGEEYFSSLSKIIENHQKNPLVLIDSQSNTKDTTKLCYPVKP